MKKLNLRGLFENKIFLWILSFLVALVFWTLVISNNDQNYQATFYDIPVEVNVSQSPAAKYGLTALDSTGHTVDVTLMGERFRIGGLKSSDVKVNAILNNVNTAGLFELHLEAETNLGNQITTVSISPETIWVRFDTIVTKEVPIKVDVSKVTFPEGYLMGEETFFPDTVSVRGPEGELSEITEARADAAYESMLTGTQTLSVPLQLYTMNGNKAELEYSTVSPETVDVTIPIYKIREVPVEIEFINVPDGFPIHELEYEFDHPTVSIAGPETTIDLLDHLSLGYLDVRDLDLEAPYRFELVVPSGYLNLETFEYVSVQFKGKNYSSKVFTVTDIRLTGVPSGYEATVTTEAINDVLIIGPEETLESMIGTDIIAEIDLSDREVSEGQIRVTASIFVPGKGVVWANGVYQAQVTIRKK